ncbi:MAG: hypothetical protein MI743_13205, partial [Sneathiellales bacterium]|nr:hypothetical protein [Sneathiellales bacterium]
MATLYPPKAAQGLNESLSARLGISPFVLPELEMDVVLLSGKQVTGMGDGGFGVLLICLRELAVVFDCLRHSLSTANRFSASPKWRGSSVI